MYHTYAQIERSHRTWKNFLFFDVIGDIKTFMENPVQTDFDWALRLPTYQHLYNTTTHKSIGNQLWLKQPLSRHDYNTYQYLYKEATMQARNHCLVASKDS